MKESRRDCLLVEKDCRLQMEDERIPEGLPVGRKRLQIANGR